MLFPVNYPKLQTAIPDTLNKQMVLLLNSSLPVKGLMLTITRWMSRMIEVCKVYRWPRETYGK